MGLFDNYNEIEKDLLNQYSQTFAAMGVPDAKKVAKDILNAAIKKSKEVGTYNLPPNFGEIILKNTKAESPEIEKVAEFFRKTLDKKRGEGVKDEDIKWWWNLNDVERYMMVEVDNMHRTMLYITKIQDGISQEEATKIVWRHHPTYVFDDPTIKPEKPEWLEREDFPLPIELKDRVNIWIQKRSEENPEKIKKEIESSSTLNTLIRKEIKAGNI